jgi:hypothetical protein
MELNNGILVPKWKREGTEPYLVRIKFGPGGNGTRDLAPTLIDGDFISEIFC